MTDCDICGSDKSGVVIQGNSKDIPDVHICRDCFLVDYNIDTIRREKSQEKKKGKPKK